MHCNVKIFINKSARKKIRDNLFAEIFFYAVLILFILT